MTEHTGFIDRIRRDPALAQFFEHRAYFLMEYDPVRDELTVYDCLQQSLEVLPGYLSAALPERAQIFAEDRWQMHALLTGELNGPLELRFQAADGTFLYRELDARPLQDPERGTLYVGYAKDTTAQNERVQELVAQAHHDSLTQLYNNRTGKEMISRYLQDKGPYSACGMLVIDLDFFKNVNDRYGHLFGDKVLQEFARLLRTLFRPLRHSGAGRRRRVRGVSEGHSQHHPAQKDPSAVRVGAADHLQGKRLPDDLQHRCLLFAREHGGLLLRPAVRERRLGPVSGQEQRPQPVCVLRQSAPLHRDCAGAAGGPGHRRPLSAQRPDLHGLRAV